MASKSLVVVESPTKSKTLAKYLGRNFDIVATMGHIIDLPKSKLGVDTEDDFQPQYRVLDGKKKVVEEIKKAARKADIVYLASDPDREGEAIAHHVAQIIEPLGKEVKRALFNEITRSGVQHGIDSAGELDLRKVDAQQARRILDRLVGYKISPILWSTVYRGLSAGRVQSVALRMICERESEIAAFVAQEYWTIDARVGSDRKHTFLARLHKVGGKKAEVPDQATAQAIVSAVAGKPFVVAGIKREKKRRYPQPPYITSTLQQDAIRRLRFTSHRTMKTAQELYEGVELGKSEGPVGLITYMRTDSVRVAGEALDAARDVIRSTYGAEYLPEQAIQYKTRKSAQDAHEAIRPSMLDHPPEKVRAYLSKEQFRLYEMIWNRFVACQMTPAVYDATTIDLDVESQYAFRATASVQVFDGFLKVYEELADEDAEEEKLIKLPPLSEGDRLHEYGLTPEQHFTKPPPRFTEASLIRELEHNGIGRPSTYSQILTTLRSRKYTETEQRRITPTELGMTVNKILVEHFGELFNVKFTAQMEEELDLIEEGDENWVDVLRDFYEPFSEQVTAVAGMQKEIKEEHQEETGETCEKCGKAMIIKWGRNGRFLACTGYPECKTTRPLNGAEVEATDYKCPECQAPMVIRSGRFGKFLACSRYPECKTTQPVPTGVKCPESGCTGDMVERRSRRGKNFYSCSRYPDCKYATWNYPVSTKCPACAFPLMTRNVTKTHGEHLRCPACGHRELHVETAAAEA
jgi:DNA topoisomerase I